MGIESSDDRMWMEHAYEQALLAKAEGEIPVGAVLVSSDNTLLSVGHNRLEKSRDPIDHAEVVAIRRAAQKLKNHRLLDTTLYVTLEPCIMCAGLLLHARIKRLVFATRDFKRGAAGSVFNLLQGYPLYHPIIIDEGFLQAKCAALLTSFFQKKRRN